jgi:hypothetical protein
MSVLGSRHEIHGPKLTALPGKSENHFICLVHSGGRLYELDGLKAAPINRGPSSPETLLKDAVNPRKYLDGLPRLGFLAVDSLTR